MLNKIMLHKIIDIFLVIFFYCVFIALASVLSTVFIFASNNVLVDGIVTAKYFWFAASVCIVSFFIPFQLFQKKSIHVSDVLFAAFTLYISINYFCLNGAPSMQWWLLLLMFPLYIVVRLAASDEKLRRWLFSVILIVVLAQAVWGLLQLYGFARSYHNLYKITGTFFNPGPYSGFVAVGVPLALSYSLSKTLSRFERWLGMATLLACALVLPAAMSRAAWIAAIAGCVPVLIQVSSFKFRVSSFRFQVPIFNFTKIVIAAFITIALLAGAYYLKKDSADGRYVIWSASIEAVKENPVFGAGYGRFTAVYGDAQASYFLKKERSAAQIMVADSPDYAFNEYVQMTVELGIVGLILFLFLIGSCFIKIRSLTTNHCSLITILVFAAFSYPFSVLPLVIMFVFLLALSAPASKKLSFTLPVWLRVIGVAIFFSITAYGAHQILPKRAAYKEWSSVRTLYNVNLYHEAAKEYASLYAVLRHEKYFLFEYAQSLSKTGQYTESNRIFEEYLLYGSDPMVYNCMGNNYKEMGDYAKAENMYNRASQIVPNRHYPLYLLMMLYQETAQIEKAKAMAGTLLDKPVKVQSTAIREMQLEAKRIIEN